MHTVDFVHSIILTWSELRWSELRVLHNLSRLILTFLNEKKRFFISMSLILCDKLWKMIYMIGLPFNFRTNRFLHSKIWEPCMWLIALWLPSKLWIFTNVYDIKNWRYVNSFLLKSANNNLVSENSHCNCNVISVNEQEEMSRYNKCLVYIIYFKIPFIPF